MKIQKIITSLFLGSIGFAAQLHAEQFFCISNGSGVADLFPGEGDFSVNTSFGTQNGVGIVNFRSLDTTSGCYAATLYARAYAAGEQLYIETHYDLEWSGNLNRDQFTKDFASLHIKQNGQLLTKLPLQTAGKLATLAAGDLGSRYVRAYGASLQSSSYTVPADGSYSFEICEAIPRSTVSLKKLRITNTQNQDCANL